MARGTSRAEQSFEEFMRETGNQVFRSALLLCGDWHLAEDLTQTTYAKVFAAWSKVRRADSALAYTRTVLVNTHISHARLKRTGERPTAALPDTVAPAADPAAWVETGALLRQLAPLDRAVLVLRFYEDLTVNQTAAELRISANACRTRTSRALARLRQIAAAEESTELEQPMRSAR